MQQIKTVSDFKKALQIGVQVHSVFHMAFNGRDEAGKVIYKDEDKGVRPVSIKQTNSFALKTLRTDGKICDSWCDYPKASMCKIEDNKVIILERDSRQFKGGHASESNPEYAALPLIPVLTYSIL